MAGVDLYQTCYGDVRRLRGWKGDLPFRYPGQYHDDETGLYYNRFRYYDPVAGMYISEDPIGLASGNPTLYGYVGDVNGQTDVFGLSSFLFRADDFYKKGADIGTPIGADADITDVYSHVMKKEGSKTSIFTSFPEYRANVIPKFGTKGVKIPKDVIQDLADSGDIKVYTPDDVKSIVGGKKG